MIRSIPRPRRGLLRSRLLKEPMFVISRAHKRLVAICVALTLVSSYSDAVAKENVPQTALHSVVTVVAGRSQGTGFAYGAARRLVTNAHVVGTSRRVEVMTQSGRRLAG